MNHHVQLSLTSRTFGELEDGRAPEESWKLAYLKRSRIQPQNSEKLEPEMERCN